MLFADSLALVGPVLHSLEHNRQAFTGGEDVDAEFAAAKAKVLGLDGSPT